MGSLDDRQHGVLTQLVLLFIGPAHMAQQHDLVSRLACPRGAGEDVLQQHRIVGGHDARPLLRTAARNVGDQRAPRVLTDELPHHGGESGAVDGAAGVMPHGTFLSQC